MEIKNWFKRKTSAATRALTMFFPLHQGVSSKTRYDALAREGYMQNSVVHACIKEIAEAAAGVPWILSRKLPDGAKEPVSDHPLLRLLARPNPFHGKFEFFENLVSCLYLSGNAYIEAVAPGRGQPRELYMLRPDRMTVIPSKVDFIQGYEYRVSGQSARFTRDQVMHLKLFHPLDDWYGLSPVQVASLAVDKLNSGDKWNTALLQNSAVPSGALVSKKRLSDEQFDRLKQEMRDQSQGPSNARLPLLLEEEIDWKEIGISPKDMDWLEGMKFSALQIAQIYNIPPELIGLQPATYQNRKEARKALYSEVVIPALGRVRDSFNHWLTPRFVTGTKGGHLTLDFDEENIGALSDDRESKWKRANECGFLTINEKRKLVDYPPIPQGDVLMDPEKNPAQAKPNNGV